MKTISIDGKEYTLEFTIEAALYNECTEKVVNLMSSMNEAKDNESTKELITSMSDIPQTTLTMFYAGLLEHHGEDGDGTVLNKKDAKRLIKKYFEEHKEDETGNFYGVMEILIDVMDDDDFFNQIGLNQLAGETEKHPKTPQDHKRKQTVKATEK